MAKKHILSLEIPTVANCEIFTIWDTSEYAEELPVDCPTLSVVPPGFQNPISIEQSENFHRDFSTCAFGLQTMDCSNTRNTFPDGVYVIRWSVAPHDKVYVEYNHMRVTTILSAYYEKLCDIDAKPCEPSSDMISLMEEMKYIRSLIDAAKAKVEYCHEPNAGMQLYDFAKKRLEKITCEVVCCK